MKKLLLLCTFLLVFLMGGCAKKDYDCNFVMSRENKFEAMNMVLDSGNDSVGTNIMNIVRTAKACRRDDDIAAKEYYEWVQVIQNINRERFRIIDDVNDFIDNYDGRSKNIRKFVDEEI